MYRLEFEETAVKQLEDLPQRLLPRMAELFGALELQPWGGAPYNRERPHANMRLHSIGQGEE